SFGCRRSGAAFGADPIVSKRPEDAGRSVSLRFGSGCPSATSSGRQHDSPDTRPPYRVGCERWMNAASTILQASSYAVASPEGKEKSSTRERGASRLAPPRRLAPRGSTITG